MPCAMYIRRRSENLFKKEYPFPLSCAATDWLAYIESSEGLTIQHLRNGSEFKIDNKIFVDGFCAASNTVYQFHGCWLVDIFTLRLIY